MQDMEKELRKVFDAMPLDQLSDELNNIELEPLSPDSEQRIKDMVKEKMKKENVELAKKSKSKSKRWLVAAAAFVFAFIGAAIYKADDVKAEFTQLFGFVPGVGVVEVDREENTVAKDDQNTSDLKESAGDKKKDSKEKDSKGDTAKDGAADKTPAVQATKWYLLENVDATASDEMIRVELKDAVVAGDKLELRYAVRLLKITDEELEAAYAALNGVDESALKEMYVRLGYDKYFLLDGKESLVLKPSSNTTVNGKAVKASKMSVGGSETTEGSRVVCISETYDVKDVLTEEIPSGTLDIAGVKLDFKMKKLDLGGSPEDVIDNGFVEELNGVKVMCVPTWKDQKLFVDFYTMDSGDYSAVLGFNMFGRGSCITTVNGQSLEDVGDDSYAFEDMDSSYLGRNAYDLNGLKGEVQSAKVKTNGLWVRQNLENKKLELTPAATVQQELDDVLKLDGSNVEFVEMSNRPCDSVEDFDYSEHGYLVLTYRAEDADVNKQFMWFGSLSVNGENVEDFTMECGNVGYSVVLIPLPVPYSEVRTVEFTSADYMLNGNMEFDLKK